MVTGTTSGIGYEVALALAQLGAHVVMVGRTADRAQAARQQLISRGVPDDRLDGVGADLSRPAQVAQLAASLAARYPALDILVNNAGCYPAARVITPEGFEESWATNVLAYEIFTTVLRPSIEAAAGRVVYVSSSMSFGLNVNDLAWEKRVWSGMRAYSQTKQADTMLAWAWQRRFDGSGAVVNVAHPDGTATNIAGRQRGVWGLLTRFAFSTQRPPAAGADTAVWLAASPEVTGGGGFYVRRSPRDNQYQDDVDASEHLWKITQEQIAGYIS